MLTEFIKFVLVGSVFFGAAPVAGFLMKDRRSWQRAAFALMCFMTLNGLLAEGNWGKTLASIEWYRGHTKGFHFYFNHALAIALLVAAWRENPQRFLRPPPGLLAYWIYCAVSMVSIVTAPNPWYVLMAAQKMFFASVLFLAVFHFLRNHDDVAFFLKVMAFTLLWEAFVVLKMKYFDGMYQVRGTFEHQNPLSMYAVMIGMVFLAVGLGPQMRGDRWCQLAFVACAIIVQSTLSRGGMVVFALGSIVVVALCVVEKVTRRRLLVISVMALVGAIGLLLTADTISARFNDHGNQASGELRDVLNEASRQMVRDHPLGVGWNNFGLTINHPYPYANVVYDWLEERNMPVDYEAPNALVESHYYLLLAENGYPGWAAYLTLISCFLWKNLRAAIAYGSSPLRWVSVGIGTGCALNYLQSMLERVLTQPRNLMLWLILLGLTSRLDAWRRESAENSKSRTQ